MTLVVAAVQFAPLLGAVDDNRARIARAIVEAAGRGAKLVVLPELCTSGYVFDDAAEAHASSEPLDGPAVESWTELARRHELIVVGGLCERGDGGVVHNAAVVVDQGGLVAAYRKTHLWDREKEIFEKGTTPSPVIETAHGRIGIAICYDSFFPEVMRGLSLARADLIVVPMNSPATVPPVEPQSVEVSMAVASAAANRVFVVQVDRTGRERGVDWTEASVIVGPDGRLLAGPASGEAILVAELALEQAREKAYGERNDVILDRRVELYEFG